MWRCVHAILLLLLIALPQDGATRFLSSDPVPADAESGEGFNRYAYAESNPYRNVDPDGRWAEDVFVGVPSLGLGAKSLYDNARAGNVGAAIVDSIGIAYDAAAILVPGVPGGAGLGIRAGRVATALPDSANVCRGGTCTAQRFEGGTGVSLDAAGRLQNVSVNSAPGMSVEELAVGVRNSQVGSTTVGAIRQAGGDVVPSPTPGNAAHCTLCGITPAQAETLFTPTTPNPQRGGQ